MLQKTTANLSENQESCLGGTCTLLDRKKRDDKITQPKHPGQHEQSIYPRTLCILTHLDINKTAKVCYSNLNVEFST